MNKIKIATKVIGKHRDIFSKFDKNLFKKLKPPLVEINILRFGDLKIGEIIELEITPLFTKPQIWHSLICAVESSDMQSLFVDVGKKLPWPLKSWEHKHQILQVNDLECEIIDDITYTCHNFFLELVCRLPMWLMFYYRRKIYKKIFGSL